MLVKACRSRSYLFVVTSADAPPHTKERVLVNWMTTLKCRGIPPKFTFSDKDQSEINALSWPTAKHHLCFWHVLRALRRRLANNREPPAFYHSVDVKKKFQFIDSAFLPAGQMSEIDRVCTCTYAIWPVTLIYHRPPYNHHPKSPYDQCASLYTAVPQSTRQLLK